MARERGIKVLVEGDVGRALAWEAGRRGTRPQELALSLIATQARDIVDRWRQAAAIDRGGRRRPGPSQVGAFESVLLKAYGPGRAGRCVRA